MESENLLMRLFIAIDLPEELKLELSELSAELIRQASAGRTIPPDNFHITLVFIGEVIGGAESVQLAEVKAAMQAVVGRMRPGSLVLTLGGIGSFKNSRSSHNWWVGVEQDPQLVALAGALADELRERGLAIERRNFMPHITIGRGVKTARPVALDLATAPLQFTARNIYLMRSDRKHDQQVYSEIFAVQL